MSFKRIVIAICSFVLCLALVACGDRKPNGRPQGGGHDPSLDPVSGDINDNNDVTITEPTDKTAHDFAVVSNNNGTIVFECSDCDAKDTVVISCAAGTNNAYSVAGNTITFSGIAIASEYNISGKLHGNIVIDVTDNYKFELAMSGFELYSHDVCPVNVKSGDKVTLSAKKDTVNYIYDMRAAVDESSDDVAAAVYAQCDLDVQGKGTLNIKSENNNGIHTKDDLKIKNLTLQTDCLDNALKGNDSVTIESGNIVVIARKGDGIKTTNSDVSSKGNQRGTVAVKGGNILVYAACDGIDAAYDVTVDESVATVDLQVFTDKYSKYSQEVTSVSESTYYVRYNQTSYKYSLKFYNDDSDGVWKNSSSYTRVGNNYYYAIEKPNGYAYVQLFIYSDGQQQGQGSTYVACTEGERVNNNYDTLALRQSMGGGLSYSWTNYTTTTPSTPGRPGMGGGMNEGNPDKGDHSTKGIKADNAVSVAAGGITVSAYDDAIHASNDATLENGSSPLGNVSITGGKITLRSNDDAIHGDGAVSISDGTVNIVGSHEGVEGKTVSISGGNVSIVANDDGINGTAKSGNGITVSGGKLYVFSGGDGVDSNSQTNYEGIRFTGGKSVIISTGPADSSIDTERGYKYTGGYVVAVCRSGGMSSEATKCENFSSAGTSQTVSLTKDAYIAVDGVAEVKVPATMNSLVVCLGKTNVSISQASTASGTVDANGVYWIA